MTLPLAVIVRGLSVGRRDSVPGIGVLIVRLADRLLLHAFPRFGRQAGHLKRRPTRGLAHSASIQATTIRSVHAFEGAFCEYSSYPFRLRHRNQTALGDLTDRRWLIVRALDLKAPGTGLQRALGASVYSIAAGFASN
jgi:hypothetical protein